MAACPGDSMATTCPRASNPKSCRLLARLATCRCANEALFFPSLSRHHRDTAARGGLRVEGCGWAHKLGSLRNPPPLPALAAISSRAHLGTPREDGSGDPAQLVSPPGRGTPTLQQLRHQIHGGWGRGGRTSRAAQGAQHALRSVARRLRRGHRQSLHPQCPGPHHVARLGPAQRPLHAVSRSSRLRRSEERQRSQAHSR